MEEPATECETVYCLRPYNPFKINGVRNPHFDRALDGRLLDFKDGQHYAVAAEAKLFRAALGVIDLPPLSIVAVVMQVPEVRRVLIVLEYGQIGARPSPA
jgi:hypothetical protein